jgi:hypothetical protein
MIKKNLAVIINIITLLCAISFGYGFLNRDIQNTKENVAKNEECIKFMRNEWQRDVKIILEKVNTLEGYIKARAEIEKK